MILQDLSNPTSDCHIKSLKYETAHQWTVKKRYRWRRSGPDPPPTADAFAEHFLTRRRGSFSEHIFRIENSTPRLA